jgi:sirohydrochlorin cobaltochelatase
MATAIHRPAQLPVTDVFTFGQILVRPIAPAGFRLSHRDDGDAPRASDDFSGPEDALEIARLDDAGSYRPLKTAPNLRHGWRLVVANAAELYRALDFFYPGRLSVLAAYQDTRLISTSLRETLGRQTGMYRVAGKITDAQLDEIIGNFCQSDGGCLRTILWKRDHSGAAPSPNLPAAKYDPDYDQVLATDTKTAGFRHVPLICQESCNLLVAECRKAAKATPEEEQ